MKISTGATGTVTRTIGEGDDAFTLSFKVPSFRERLAYMAVDVAAEIDPARGADRLEYQLSLVEGWGNVVDEQGNAIPFSQETLRAAVATDAAFAYTVATAAQQHIHARLSQEQAKN